MSTAVDTKSAASPLRPESCHDPRGSAPPPTLKNFFHTAWGFVESDLPTFALPNTIFGISGALAGPRLVDGPPQPHSEIWQRSPVVMLFNLYSVFVFNLANQSSADAAEEDRINKPWRPIPSGTVTPKQTRRAMLVVAPAALCLNHALGVWEEGLLVQTLCWYYNDLGGGDEPVRDAIVAAAYGLANLTSLRLAIGPENAISRDGYAWVAMIGGVVFTTIHIQDLKDQAGDAARSRNTVPGVLGESFCRCLLAVLVPAWSFFCVGFWAPNWIWRSYQVGLGVLVAWRLLTRRTPRQDARTWRLWCLWHTSLYALPIIGNT